MKTQILLGLIICIMAFMGCKKLIEVDTPSNQLTKDKVFGDQHSAEAVLLNIYSTFTNILDGNLRYVPLYSDEMLFQGTANANINEFYQSFLSVGNGFNSNIWNTLYSVIYMCNDLIEQVANNENITPDSRIAILSEAHFFRAFSMFYLLNFYGNIPLVLSTDINQNRLIGQSEQSEIFNQIESDLKEAENGLSNVSVPLSKSRVSLWAVKSFLARVYLFQQEWEYAEFKASEVIESGLFSLEALDNVFKYNSAETILSFWTQNGVVNNAIGYIPSDNSSVPQYFLYQGLYELFLDNDLRREIWIGKSIVSDENGSSVYYYPFKYKNSAANLGPAAYLVIFRLAEQYLIRAEARFMRGDLENATEDINALRTRAEATLLDYQGHSDLEEALINERRLELFTEWGHRFLDLKRVNKANDVLAQQKETWQSNTSLNFPIPESEITYNPNLFQNSGY